MTALADLSEAIEGVVRLASPSVLSIEHAGGQGSGLVIASDGYVVTNSHVVRGAGELVARLAPGEHVGAELVGDDPASDLAVVRLRSGNTPSLPLLEERRLRVGQLVLAIGNPLRFDRSVSLGVVSALDRTLPAGPGRSLEGLVQTDAAINPGSSGGPLLDAHGTAVGITTAVIPRARGIGFAIPAHTVSWVVAMLLKQGRIE
ncbi:MAG TPA: trypsin-like peptidase domain-containing protein, partial [Polyangiaceae bacterium]|nr:trypsin-like peptidase domain-containing protein [Polyangiaceae bacterium]